MKDPLDNGLNFLRTDRERLYRRIITHHVLFDISDEDANDWIRECWDEGIRDPGLQNEQAQKRWDELTRGMKRKFAPQDKPNTSRSIPFSKVNVRFSES